MSMPTLKDAPWGTFAPRGWRSAWIRMLHGLPASPAWRRPALWLRKPVKNALGEWVDLRVWGLRLRLRGHGNLSEQRLALMPQYLDSTERDALAAALENGGVFLDIGANAGIYTLWAGSLRHPDIHIHAFEPDPELCTSLQSNLDLNELSSARLHRLALGRSEGEATLISGDGNSGENTVETGSSDRGVTVVMTTLPSWLERHRITRIDVLKIDVEGHETDVLEPLFSIAPREVWPRLLICESVHDLSNKLNRLLAENGYRLAKKGRLNGIYRLD
jgi:FkbM family methyltransferase